MNDDRCFGYVCGAIDLLKSNVKTLIDSGVTDETIAALLFNRDLDYPSAARAYLSILEDVRHFRDNTK